MTSEDLAQIKIHLENGSLKEGTTVEFKTVLPRDSAGLAKVFTSMANTDGGFVIIGITERNGLSIVKGISDRDKREIADRINWISHHFSSGIELNCYFDSIGGKEYAVIEVPRSKQTVYYSRKDTTPERIIEYTRSDLAISAIAKANYTRLFKYMTLDALILSLSSKSWRFWEPTKWEDQFERRFYCAKYCPPHQSHSAPKLYATCVTREAYSKAAWKVYSNGAGLKTHCAQLELDVKSLREQLRKTDFQYYERSVKYMLESEILNLHKQSSPSYKLYFNPFTKNHFLDLLSIKRKAFSYENEVRLFAVPQDFSERSIRAKCESKDFKINWKDIIKSIRIDSKCSLAELQSLQYGLLYNGIRPSFIGKTKVPPVIDCPFLTDTTIIVEEYDIDAMPGSRRIRIK